MQEPADKELLWQYAQGKSEEAFAKLVARHVNMVYSAALRKTGNPHAAEEITQAVFIILARKAHRLAGDTIVSGWLYQTTRLTSSSYLRTEFRRARREQEACMQSLSNETEAEFWPRIAPLLEDAMAGLSEKERNAIALRFFEGKRFSEIGTAFGTSENAAKKRVSHALEKLRRFFTRRGVLSTTAIIAGAMTAHSVQAAPAVLAETVTAVAIAQGAAAGSSTLALVKGALKLMAWTKAKTAVVATAVLLAGGAATIGIKEVVLSQNKDHLWQVEPLDIAILDKVPPMARVVPTEFPKNGGSWITTADGRLLGLDRPLVDVLVAACGYEGKEARVLRSPTLAPEHYQEPYDYITSFRAGGNTALREELERKFGLAGRSIIVETNVCYLRVKQPNHQGLQRATPKPPGNNTVGSGRVVCTAADMAWLAQFLENKSRMPVIDQTKLTGEFNFVLTWDEYAKQTDGAYPHLEELKGALPDQLGLELVPGREQIEMLVVEKVK